MERFLKKELLGWIAFNGVKNVYKSQFNPPN